MFDQALTNPRREDVTELNVAFLSSFWGSLALCAFIHVMAPMFPDPDMIRLGLVILFFGCLASASWSLTDPYARSLAATYRWKYADASPSIRSNVDRFVVRQARYVSGVGWFATAAIGCIALAVLSEWHQLAVLAVAQPWLDRLALLATLGVPIYALLTTNTLREAFVLKRVFEEEAALSGTKVRSADTEARRLQEIKAPPVQVKGAMQFRAGGYDWQWGDFYKNAAIFGMSGSGKTLCVLNALLDGLLASATAGGKPAAGLILDPKGDFRDKIARLCQAHGRSHDLMIIDPYDLRTSIRWNPLDSTDDPMEIAGRFGAVMEVINPAGGDDRFWIDSSKRLVQNLIALIRATRPDMPPSLSEVHDAAMSDALLDRWGECVTVELLNENKEARRAVDYFEDVWRPMPDNTKGSIRAFVGNMLGAFLQDPYDELFAGHSTATIANMIDAGRILYVHMPIADREVMAQVVSTFVKLEYYREVLKRPNKARPSFFLCDEFQSFFTVGQGRGDADAFERTRQSNHANIIAFQNINALLKQTPRPEPVYNLLGNCAIKLFLRNTDKDTNEFASTLFGEYMETQSSWSIDMGQQRKRGRGELSSVSGSAQRADKVKKDEFTRLAVPSKEDGISYAEAMAHLAARAQVETGKQCWNVHPIS